MAAARGRLVQRLLVVNHSKFSARVVYLVKYRIVTVFEWVNVNWLSNNPVLRAITTEKVARFTRV